MKKGGIHTGINERGSALLAVLVVTLLITLLLGMIFTIYILNVKRAEQQTRAVQARYLAEAGIYKALAEYELETLIDQKAKAIRLFDSDTAFISAEPYGAYIKLHSRASVKGQQKSVSVLAGQQPGGSFEYAVALGDKRSRFSIAGSATIRGGLKVGPQGIVKRSFKGKRFTGVVDGVVHKEKEHILPEFSNSWIKHSITIFDKLLDSGASRKPVSSVFGIRDSAEVITKLSVSRFIEGDCILNSEKVQRWELSLESRIICTGTITINQKIELPPLCQLIAGKGIYINSRIEGRQLLFYTPGDIWIGENSRLSGQFLAGNRVMITGDAYLRYPSLVWVQHQEYNQQEVIAVKDQARFGGTIIYSAERPEESAKLLNRIFIGPSAKVRGSIYNTHQTEFHGQLFGTLLTYQLYFYESPTTYINWMKDGNINVKERPANYILPLGFSEAGIYDVVYWVPTELPKSKR